jgi:hypothetical protein
MTSRYDRFSFLTRTRREFKTWTHAIVHYAQQATTPWFWLHAEDVAQVDSWEELNAFVPASPLWSQTRVHIFNAPGELWGNVLLVNTKWAQQATAYYTLEELGVGIEAHEMVSISYFKPHTAELDFSYGADICQAIDRSVRGHTGHVLLTVGECSVSDWPRSELWDSAKLYSIGDSLIIDANEWAERRWEINELYDWPDQIVWQDAEQPYWPVVHDNSGDAVNVAKAMNYEKKPWFWIRNAETASSEPPSIDIKMSAWDPIRPLVRADTTGSWILVSGQAIPELQDQFLDYGNVQELDTPGPRVEHDVFFVSNGETNADTNWEILKAQCPRAQRVTDINGRRAMFQHCAALAKPRIFSL